MPEEGDSVECRECGARVWPERDGQPHRNCNNCGTRIWFEEWAREKFGSGDVPDFVGGPEPVWTEADNESSEESDDSGEQSTIDDY